MKNDLLNILANSNKDIDNQLLMDYVSGKLSATDQHAVEEWLQANEFEAEALEGLQEFGNKEHLQEYVQQLNHELKRFIQQKKQRREKRVWKDTPWTYLAIVLVLGLLLIVYTVIHIMGK